MVHENDAKYTFQHPHMTFYWNTVITYHLCFISGCLLATKAELSSWNREYRPCSAWDTLPFTKNVLWSLLSTLKGLERPTKGLDSKPQATGRHSRGNVARSGRTGPLFSERHRLSILPLSTLCNVFHICTSFCPTSILWRDRCILLPFYVGHFFFCCY